MGDQPERLSPMGVAPEPNGFPGIRRRLLGYAAARSCPATPCYFQHSTSTVNFLAAAATSTHHALHSGGLAALGTEGLVQPSARFTACGSRSMILSSVRAGPVGLRRPCSQFSKVRLLTFRNVAI